MSMGPGAGGPAGWPDQQAAPPTPPPGYSPYPQQQAYPPPQAYPQNPGSQGFGPPGQYGYPSQQQQYNAPPPPKKSKAPWIIGAVVVVLLIAAGAGYFVMNSKSKQADANAKGGAGNPPTTTLSQLWTTSGANDNLVGVWQTDHSVVHIGSSGANAYDLASGRKLFSIAPPKPGLEPCSASATLAPGGIGSIFYSEDGHFSCDTVIGVDVNTGKHLWTLHSSDSVVDAATGSSFIDGSVVVIASDSGAVAGVEARTGRVLWSYTSTAKGCSPANTAGMGSVVIVQENCRTREVGKGNYVALDAATGKRLWKTATAQYYSLTAVVSTNPVVLLVASSKSTVKGLDIEDGKKFLAFDGSGKQTASIPADSVQVHAFLNTSFPHALVSNGTLYAETTGAKGGTAVTAYSLSSGAKLWSYQAAEIESALNVETIGLATDSSPLVVVDLHMIGNASPVMKLDPATGKPSQVITIPGSADPDESVLVKASNGDYVLAPQIPQQGPGITVLAPK